MSYLFCSFAVHIELKLRKIVWFEMSVREDTWLPRRQKSKLYLKCLHSGLSSGSATLLMLNSFRKHLLPKLPFFLRFSSLFFAKQIEFYKNAVKKLPNLVLAIGVGRVFQRARSNSTKKSLLIKKLVKFFQKISFDEFQPKKKGNSFVLWFHRVFFMHQCPKFFSDAHQAILNQKGEKNDLEI